MEKYDYEAAVRADIMDWLNENGAEYADADGTISDHGEYNIHDALWIADSVTGNASGSYTFNNWRAEEYLCHNLELLGEALREFNCAADYVTTNGAEAADSTIRLYLMGNLLPECIDAYNEAHEHEEEKED